MATLNIAMDPQVIKRILISSHEQLLGPMHDAKVMQIRRADSSCSALLDSDSITFPRSAGLASSPYEVKVWTHLLCLGLRSNTLVLLRLADAHAAFLRFHATEDRHPAELVLHGNPKSTSDKLKHSTLRSDLCTLVSSVPRPRTLTDHPAPSMRGISQALEEVKAQKLQNSLLFLDPTVGELHGEKTSTVLISGTNIVGCPEYTSHKHWNALGDVTFSIDCFFLLYEESAKKSKPEVDALVDPSCATEHWQVRTTDAELVRL